MGHRASSLYYCGRRRRWFYAFVVTAAATFLAALPFLAERSTFFEAHAWVLPPSGTFQNIEDAVGQFSSGIQDALPAVVERVTGQTCSADELDRLAAATTIRKEQNNYNDCVLLSLRWDSAERAEQLVRTLADELSARKNREIPVRTGVLLDEATATRQCAEILRDDARADVVELKQLIAGHDNRATAANVVTAPPKPAARAVAINPAWASLRQQLEKIDSQRLKMLELYTAEHPLIANLTAQRDELESKLAQTPKELETKQETSPQEKIPSEVTPAPSKSSIAERQRLLEMLAASERELATAEEFVRQSLESENRVRSAPPVTPARWEFHKYADAEAHIGSPIRAPWQRLSLVSLLAGSIVAVGVVGIRPTYESAAEALARLPVPVVGIIPAEEPLRRPVSLRRWAARLVGVGEWVLIAAVVFLSLAIWKEPVFGQRLLADPLTVLATPADWVPWLREYVM